MNSSQLQDRIAFFKEKIAIAHLVKSQILQDDPYRDVKLKAMEDRIRTYQEEIERLHPEKMSNWA